MKIKYIAIGKGQKGWLREGAKEYLERLNHYVPFEYLEAVPKAFPGTPAREAVVEREARLLETLLRPGDYLVLLHEGGKEYTSMEFASWLQTLFNKVPGTVVFVSGGPFGFAASVHGQARASVSLSRMTFTHQMVRPVFLEQLFRAMKILRNETYHY